VKNLIKLAQARDVFVIDLIQTINLTQVELHEMFLDPFITFKYDSFAFFKTLVKGKHETILMRWFTNLNSGIDHLAFECQTNHIWAQARDSNTKVKCYVTGTFLKQLWHV